MNRNTGVDGLRVYCAVAVLIHHAILMIDPAMVTLLYNPIYEAQGIYYKIIKLTFLCFNGEAAVAVLFIMSGMVLFNSLLVQLKRQQRLIALSFIVKRIIRFYPPLIVCLVVFYLLLNGLHLIFPGFYPGPSVTALIQNCLLYKISLHGATWTMQAEGIAVFFILLSFFAYNKWGVQALLLLSFLSIALLDNNILLGSIPGIGRWLYFFFIGFLCAIFPTEQFKKQFEIIGWKVPFLVILFFRGFFSHTSVSVSLLISITVAYFLLFLNTNIENKMTKFLNSKHLQTLGRLSFSFYLWNVVILNIFAPFSRFALVRGYPLEFGLLFATIVFFITLPLAYYSEKYIERPSIRFGKFLLSPSAKQQLNFSVS